MKVVFLSCVLVLTAALAFAHSGSYGSPFPTGYDRGYSHGQADYHQRLSFDYSNAAKAQTNDWNDCEYRLGYIQGYTDGYFSIPKKMDLDQISPGDRDHGYGQGNQNTGVTVYTESNFHGKSSQFEVGDYPKLEGSFNDTIESLQINGNLRVILFDGSDFKGESRIITQTTSDLGSFKNKAASMIVDRLSHDQD